MTRFGAAVLSLLALTTAVASDKLGTQVEHDFRPGALGMEVPIIRPGDKLDDYVGRLVAVRGVVDNTKITSINGIRINADETLRGKQVYAVGILIKWTVTEEQARSRSKRGVAHDGPGTKYALYFDLGGRLAEARPIPRE